MDYVIIEIKKLQVCLNKQCKKKKHNDFEDRYITSNLSHKKKVFTYPKLEHLQKKFWLRHGLRHYVTDYDMLMQNYIISMYNLDAEKLFKTNQLFIYQICFFLVKMQIFSF